MELTEKKCVPCEGNTPRIEGEGIQPNLKNINSQWYVSDGKKISRKFNLGTFKKNIKFVNRIAELAEDEGHHPDLCISWNILEVSLWTHAIGGLSEHDFIIAAKIDEMYQADYES